MTARDHNNLLGIFIMIKGGILAFVGILLGLIYGGVGVALLGAAKKQDEQIAGGALMAFGVVIGLFLIAIAIFDLFAGSRVRKVAPVGRVLGIIVCIMSLFSFPLGTALGIYGLWFFFGDLGKSLYLGSEAPAGACDPPPPNSWQ